VKENGKTMADAEGDVLRGLRKYIVLDCYLDCYRSGNALVYYLTRHFLNNLIEIVEKIKKL